MAQTASTHEQQMVESVMRDVNLSAEQITQLTSAATQYVSAIQTANEQYVSNEEILVQAKAAAWQTYTMQMRTILTDEQYQGLQQKQMERRNAVLNISDTNLSRGEHSFSTNLNKLNNGVYLLVTQIDNKNSINKFAKF